MPLLQQWVRQRPWLAAGLAVSATGLAGLSGGALAAAGALGLAVGGIAGSRPIDDATHPLRRRILSTLEDNPGFATVNSSKAWAQPTAPCATTSMCSKAAHA